jgi:hypothetical protein
MKELLLLAVSPGELKVPQVVPSENLVGNVLRTVFTIAALLSVIFVIIGSIKYVTSAGDPTSIQKAKNTILYAIIGLVVALSAFTIVSFVLSRAA